jgi:hypothetical protein
MMVQLTHTEQNLRQKVDPVVAAGSNFESAVDHWDSAGDFRSSSLAQTLSLQTMTLGFAATRESSEDCYRHLMQRQ